jgi:amicyanin
MVMFMKKVLAFVFLLFLVACQPEAPPQPVMAPPQQVMLPPIVEPPAQAPPAATSPQTVNVEIKGFSYQPAEVRVKVGDTVVWTQVDSVQHTVTIVSGPEMFSSALLNAGETYSHTFTQPGTYEYKCNPHPNMRGRVIVE